MSDPRTYHLTMPPSQNALTRNTTQVERNRMRALGRPVRSRVKTERYQEWANVAGWELNAQRPTAIKGAVHLTFSINENETNADLGNLEKAATDLLVSLGVIEDDNKRIVRKITIMWSEKVERFAVTVEPFAQEARHAA